MAIVTDYPADEGKEELSKGRMDVEEVGALEIVGGELGTVLEARSTDLETMYTFPKWTSSKTTSSGWLMPKNRVAKASVAIMVRASL